jgi:hypothetical protein
MVRKNYYFPEDIDSVESQKVEAPNEALADKAAQVDETILYLGSSGSVDRPNDDKVSFPSTDLLDQTSNEDSLLGFNGDLHDTVNEEKISEIYKLKISFVSLQTVMERHPNFFDRELSMLDYVNLFVSPLNLFSYSRIGTGELDKMISWIEKAKKESVWSSYNMTKQVGFSTIAQFLFQSLPGEFQLKFVISCVFHCSWILIRDPEVIRKKLRSRYGKYVILDDESIELQSALSARLYLNGRGMKQNAKLQVNEVYVRFLLAG